MNKLKFFGIPQFQKGGLINKQYSGTWGNRGQGNELQSALENGLSGLWNGAKWAFDKVINAPDYIEDGINYVYGLIPGGPTPEESVQDGRLARNTPFGESYTDSQGNTYVNMLNTGTPPPLPGLPKNPSAQTLSLYNRLIPARKSYSVRESQLRSLGQVDKLPQTKTYKLYHQLLNEFNKSLKPTKVTDNIKLTKRQNASHKAEKARVTDDLRAVNSGRSAVRERQWDEVERLMRKDKNSTVQSMLNRHDRKVAQGVNSSALRQSRINMLKWYLNNHAKGFFSWLKD